MKEPIIQLSDLSISYKNKSTAVLSDLNLSIEQGELIVLLGDNGSGKSTLLKTITGLHPYSKGVIRLKNKPISEWNKRELANELAFVGTKEVFNSYITVREFVSFGRYPFINWLGHFSKADEALVTEVLRSCNLMDLSSNSIAEVSDGERQKAIIARAIVQQTSVMVLDEPTTHLDIKNSMSVFQIMKEQSQEYNKTILFSTHQVSEAVEIASKIWIITKGSILQCLPKEFQTDPSFKEILLN